MNENDELAQDLARFETPPLDPVFARRINALANALRVQPNFEGATRRLAGALVPALLLSSATVQIATTAHVALIIFSHPTDRG
jgi:hypothetical protein